MIFHSKRAKGKQDNSCCGPEGENIEGLPKIVLVGNPNVGKSLIFNKLTGAYVMVSNYPGTTVAIDTGKCKIAGKEFGVIDSPGMYSLISISGEERITKQMLLEEKPKVVLHIIDAKNMERMLPLSMQLIEAGLPVIVVMNMMDEAIKLGATIDFDCIEGILGVPVMPVVGTTGKGIRELTMRIAEYVAPNSMVPILYDGIIESAIAQMQSLLEGAYSLSKRAVALLYLQQDEDIKRLVKQQEGQRCEKIQEISDMTSRKYGHPLSYVIRVKLQKEANSVISSCQTISAEHKGKFGERLSRVMINPITGIPILIAILYVGLYLFVGVLGAGKLVGLIEGTLFGEMINPHVTDWVTDNIPYTQIQDLLVGKYGVLPLGITYAVAIVLPIVGTFFVAFSILEDSGYLPRLSLLVDRLFKFIGLNGRAVIPIVLGLGCDSMATIVTRTLETKRERVIATLLLALAIPCSAQLGVIFAVLSGHGLALFVWLIVVILSFVLVGFLASKVLPGEKPSFYMELPPLRLPKISNVLIKTYSRMVWYFKEVFPIFILISIIIWFFQLVGFLNVLIGGLRPVVNFIGLPDDTATVFLFGFFRRDYGAAGLFDLQNSLTGVQLVVAATTLTLFVPCVAQFMIMIKERGMKTALAISVFILLFAFGVGFALNQILNVAGVTL